MLMAPLLKMLQITDVYCFPKPAFLARQELGWPQCQIASLLLTCVAFRILCFFASRFARQELGCSQCQNASLLLTSVAFRILRFLPVILPGKHWATHGVKMPLFF